MESSGLPNQRSFNKVAALHSFNFAHCFKVLCFWPDIFLNRSQLASLHTWHACSRGLVRNRFKQKTMPWSIEQRQQKGRHLFKIWSMPFTHFAHFYRGGAVFLKSM